MSFRTCLFIDNYARLAIPPLVGVENAVPPIPYGSFVARFERNPDLRCFADPDALAARSPRAVPPDFQAIPLSPPMPLMRRSRTAPDRRANRILRQDAQTTSVRPADV